MDRNQPPSLPATASDQPPVDLTILDRFYQKELSRQVVLSLVMQSLRRQGAPSEPVKPEPGGDF